MLNDFPKEYILDLYTRFSPDKVEERIGFINDFIEQNKNKIDPSFLEKNIPGQKAMVYYEGKQYKTAAEYFIQSLEKHTPDDMLYFHEHNMVARCYRLSGEYTESEKWLMKGYAQKHLMAHALELLDWLDDYVALLNDTDRKLPASFIPDIEMIVLETGMSGIPFTEDDPGKAVMAMKNLNHTENISFSRVALVLNKDREEGMKQLKAFMAASKIRFYADMAREKLAQMEGS